MAIQLYVGEIRPHSTDKRTYPLDVGQSQTQHNGFVVVPFHFENVPTSELLVSKEVRRAKKEEEAE